MKKILILSLVVVIFLAVGMIYYSKEEGSEGSVDLSIAQYSDRNITENAIKKEERFSHLAFAEPHIKSRNIFEERLASVITFLKSLLFWKSQKISKNINQEEYGVWIWTPTLNITPEYARSILDELKEEGINTVYLSIDSYLDVYTMPDSFLKIAKEKEFSQVLDNFIALAKERGILVDAEAGWRNWAEERHAYKALAILNFVQDFNARHESGFRGFQYDVEPYLLEEYRENNEGKRAVLARFVKLIDQTAEYLRESDLKFSIVVPDFYDKDDKLTPKFAYAGKKDFAFKHLLRVLDKKTDSTVIIMSYRNFAEGRDGSVEVSKNEMRTLERGGFNSNIVLAQETGDVLPDYITFYGKSKNYFKEETGKLRSAFTSNPNFTGLAIHYANTLVALE